jgi:hypothetical protein
MQGADIRAHFRLALSLVASLMPSSKDRQLAFGCDSLRGSVRPWNSEQKHTVRM